MEAKTKLWLVLSFVYLASKCMQQMSMENQKCLSLLSLEILYLMLEITTINNLPTTTKSNYIPYGIDFPSGPTGRFTNGKTTIDLIGM